MGIGNTGSVVLEPWADEAGKTALLPGYLAGETNAAVIAATLGTD
jgi:hypothetical protein